MYNEFMYNKLYLAIPLLKLSSKYNSDIHRN